MKTVRTQPVYFVAASLLCVPRPMFHRTEYNGRERQKKCGRKGVSITISAAIRTLEMKCVSYTT